MNPGFGPLKGNHQWDGVSWGHSISHSPPLSHQQVGIGLGSERLVLVEGDLSFTTKPI